MDKTEYLDAICKMGEIDLYLIPEFCAVGGRPDIWTSPLQIQMETIWTAISYRDSRTQITISVDNVHERNPPSRIEDIHFTSGDTVSDDIAEISLSKLPCATHQSFYDTLMYMRAITGRIDTTEISPSPNSCLDRWSSINEYHGERNSIEFRDLVSGASIRILNLASYTNPPTSLNQFSFAPVHIPYEIAQRSLSMLPYEGAEQKIEYLVVVSPNHTACLYVLAEGEDAETIIKQKNPLKGYTVIK